MPHADAKKHRKCTKAALTFILIIRKLPKSSKPDVLQHWVAKPPTEYREEPEPHKAVY